MTDLFNKISSYNLFNNLLPGILFVVLIKHFVGDNLEQENIFIGLFLYYFIGMTISRISSITIEPLLKFLKFVSFRNYKLFIEASKKDDKLDILLETNNMYRVLFTMIFLTLMAKIYHVTQNFWNFTETTEKYILLALMCFIYLFSYRKQTDFIKKRIDHNTNK
jgi:hypothetical protein